MRALPFTTRPCFYFALVLNMASDSEVRTHNDPNFAIICSFFEVFGKSCGLETVNIPELQKSLENTHEISNRLRDLHLKLLRRALKNVQTEKWEKGLIKFCHQQSYYQDAWELERFGYKKASIAVKLKILKNLLAYQFVCNTKFKNDVNKFDSKNLRLEPVGKDAKGRLYWLHIDKKANLRLYREDQDEETWSLLASNKATFVDVINALKSGNEPTDSSLSEIINEDSNSVEDIAFTVKIDHNFEKESNTTAVDEEDSSPESHDALNPSKGTSKKKVQLDINGGNKTVEIRCERIKLTIKNINSGIVTSENISEYKTEHENSKELLNLKLSQVENKTDDCAKPVESDASNIIDDEIEEELMIFKGEGDGSECDSYPFYIGEEITDPVLFFWGDGVGNSCFTGNPNVGASEESENKEIGNINNERNSDEHQQLTKSNVDSSSSHSPFPDVKQDNGLVVQITEENSEQLSKSVNLIKDIGDNVAVTLSTAPLPVTKRILLNIPKSDSLEDAHGESSVNKTKLWRVEDMCKGDNLSKLESYKDLDSDDKLNIKINTVLSETNGSNNGPTKSNKDETHNSCIDSIHCNTTNVDAVLCNNEKYANDCSSSSDPKPNPNSKSPKCLGSNIIFNEMQNEQNNKIANDLLNSTDDDDSNKVGSIVASSESNVNVNHSESTELKENHVDDESHLKYIDEDTSIDCVHKKINQQPAASATDVEILPKKQKIDKINPDFTGSGKNKDVANFPSKLRKTLRRTIKSVVSTDVSMLSNDLSLQPSLQLCDPLAEDSPLAASVLNDEPSEVPKETGIAVCKIASPLDMKDDLSNEMNNSSMKKSKRLRITKGKTVIENSISNIVNVETCTNLEISLKKCNLDKPDLGTKRTLRMKKVTPILKSNNVKNIKPTEVNVNNKKIEESRKRGHDDAKTELNLESEQLKGGKRLKMRSRKSLRVKYKLNNVINNHSSGEEMENIKIQKKIIKGKKHRMNPVLKIHQKETETIVKNVDIEDTNEKVQKKSKPIQPVEVDPLDISDRMPIRQSRRIAQLKIQEEAQRRQMEEIALRKLKEQHKKKGITKEKVDTEWQESAHEGSSGSEKKPKKEGLKKKIKSVRKEEKSWKTGWHSSSAAEHSDTESDGPLEELEDHEVEDDLFKEKSDHEFSPESENEDCEITPVRRARTLKKQESEEQAEKGIEEDTACVACGGEGQPEWILLCDDCDSGRHAACLKPILFMIPEGHWYCPPCDEKRLIKSLESKLEEYEELVKAVENEPELVAEPPKEEANSSEDSSVSGRSDSETDSSSEDSDGGKIYRLRERKQLPVSYHFKEYDQLISSAIKEEYHEKTSSAGNQGRGKDISTIIEADKEEKQKAKLEAKLNAENGSGEENVEDAEEEIERKRRERARAAAIRRRPRKLNSLEVLSDDDDNNSDEDFKETGWSSSSSEAFNSDSDSDKGTHSSDSLPLRRSQRDSNQSKRRKRIIESPEHKKKKRSMVSEDTSSESSGSKAWSSSKKRKNKHSTRIRSRHKFSSRKEKKKRRIKRLSSSDEGPKKPKPRVKYGGLNSDTDVSHDWSPAHRTRQVKMNYTEIPNTDSEAEAHKPSGKHMDSTDEYKAESDSSDSDSDKPFKLLKLLESSDEASEKKAVDAENMNNSAENLDKSAEPAEKTSDENERKCATKEVTVDGNVLTVPADLADEKTLMNVSVTLQAMRGRGSRGTKRGPRGGSGSRGRGTPRRSSLTTSATDGEGNQDAQQLKSDDGISAGENGPDGLKPKKEKPVLPPTPHQLERERKRLEKETKLAEREKKKQEKIRLKEEKDQLKAQKAKERDEKKQARLAFLESRKVKKLKDIEGSNIQMAARSDTSPPNNPNIPPQFRNFGRNFGPPQIRMPGHRMMRPQYPQQFFPRPGLERSGSMRPEGFPSEPHPRNPSMPSDEERDVKPRVPTIGPHPNYPSNSFGPLHMAVAHRARLPRMPGPRGDLNSNNKSTPPRPTQMPLSVPTNETRQVAPLNYTMDPRTSNASDDEVAPAVRPEPQVKGSIRALTPAELMAPGRNISQGPVGMMERLVQNPGQRSSPYMNAMMRGEPMNCNLQSDVSPSKRRGRGPGKKTLARHAPGAGNEIPLHLSGHAPHRRTSNGNGSFSSSSHSSPSTSSIPEGTLSVAGSPQPFKPATDPPSIITRMPHMMPPPYRGSSMFGPNRPMYRSQSRPPPPHMGMYRPHASHPHDPSPSGGGSLPIVQPDRLNVRPPYPPYHGSPYYQHQMPYHSTYPPLSEMPHPQSPHSEAVDERNREGPISSSPDVSRSPSSSISPRPQASSHTSPILSPRRSPHSSPHLQINPQAANKRSPPQTSPVHQERSVASPPHEDKVNNKSSEAKSEKMRARVTSAARYPQGPYAPQYASYGPYIPSVPQPPIDNNLDQARTYDPLDVRAPVLTPPSASRSATVAPPQRETTRTDQPKGQTPATRASPTLDESANLPVPKVEIMDEENLESNEEESGEFGGLVSYFSSQREDDIGE